MSNPLSALKPDTAATGEPVPLQFMVDGTIAAYRINNDYLKASYKGQELRYSSTFVLVKSQCQPDPQKEESWLDFYCLYMHLAPVNDYPGSPVIKLKPGMAAYCCINTSRERTVFRKGRKAEIMPRTGYPRKSAETGRLMREIGLCHPGPDVFT